MYVVGQRSDEEWGAVIFRLKICLPGSLQERWPVHIATL